VVTVGDASINNAEKSAAGFTVAGLDANASADVTFTDTASHQVTVHVTGNGASSANLSPLTDGAITVSILATDAAANTAPGTGSSLTLDTSADVGTALALSIPTDTTINGGAGGDTLVGGVRDDTLDGGAGNVTLIGGVCGADRTAFTTSGIDGDVTSATVTFTDSAAHTITVAASSGIADLSSFVDGAVNSVLNVTDGAGNTASAAGAPVDLHKIGVDVLAGGTGNDIYYVDNAGDQVVEAVGEGTDTVYASVDYALGAGQEVEFLRANAGATGLTLTGNGLNNTLVGAAGNDTLDGGAGNDLLVGGAGNDTFIFNTQFVGVTNVDTITDYNVANDSIQLDHTYFAGLALGQLSGSDFAIGVATGTGPQIVYDTTSGALFFDNNGANAGGASQFATLTGAPNLVASEFFIN
jgi:Ca2+-binding RTX toxin-like protein